MESQGPCTWSWVSLNAAQRLLPTTLPALPVIISSAGATTESARNSRSGSDLNVQFWERDEVRKSRGKLQRVLRTSMCECRWWNFTLCIFKRLYCAVCTLHVCHSYFWVCRVCKISQMWIEVFSKIKNWLRDLIQWSFLRLSWRSWYFAHPTVFRKEITE